MSIPTADYPLRDYAVNLYAQCKAHKAEWGLNEAALATLKERVDDYCANLAASRKPDRRKSDTVAKNVSKKALREYLPWFQGENLDFNLAVTPEIRRSLGLTLRDKTRTPVPRPERAPLIRVEIRAAGALVLHYKAEGAAGKGKPRGCFGVLIRHGVFEHSDPPPRNEEALPRVRISTSSPEDFEYKPEERGKQARFQAAWINEHGDVGPFSEVTAESVP